MKIAIPANKKEVNSDIADHFGRCDLYLLFNEEGKMVEVIENSSEHGGGRGLPPELMKDNGVNVVLCKDIGPRAINLCEELGVEVYIDRNAKKIGDIILSWQKGNLKQAGKDDACQDHKDQ